MTIQYDMAYLRVQVLLATLDKVKTLGSDYIALLGQLLDEAVSRYGLQ